MFKIRWKLLPILITLFVFNSTYAQSVKIDLSVKNESLKQFIKQIETKTDYTFMLDQTIDQSQTVTVDVRQESLDAILKKAFTGKKVSYEIVGKQILLKLATPTRKVDTKRITGVIKDQNGEPVIGANVVQKGTTNGVISDMNGLFEVNVPENTILQISYIGYLSKEMKVGKENRINVILTEDNQTLDEVVVIGYTTQKKGLLTGSVVSMNVTESMKTMPVTSAAGLLAGRMSGVNVATSDGIPGSSPTVSVRTKSSWNDQLVTYVIDGIVKDKDAFNNLSPNEIENITVLKDAASAAIYGSRSGGGVILVTTRRGSVQKPQLSYSYNYTLDTRLPNVDLTNAVELAELYNRMCDNDMSNERAWSQEELDYIKGVNGGKGYDWFDDIWQNPSTQLHNLSLNGGSDKYKYFAGVSYTDQDGFLPNLKYNKYNFRLNTTIEVTKDIEFFTGMSLSQTKQNEFMWDANDYMYMLHNDPTVPVYTDSGKFIDGGWIANRGATVSGEDGYKRNQKVNPQIVMNLTYKVPFVKGLSLKAAYSQNWNYTEKVEYKKNYDMYAMKKGGDHNHIIYLDDASIIKKVRSTWTTKESLQKDSKWAYDYQMNFQLNYNRVFKDVHSIQAALVFERAGNNYASVYGGRETFPVYNTDQFWAASDVRADTWGGGDATTESGRVSYIGQFNYSYANKYLLNFSFREDGSMNFASDKRWGFFPAGSAGWVISEESFFNKNKIDYLKLRGSVGLTGNDAVGGWQWQESYVYKDTKAAYVGKKPSKHVGITYGALVNPYLTWEKALSYNLGADMNFLNHWNTSFEYWFRKSYDILGKRTITTPTSFSQSLPDENYGQINAQGFDFNLGYQNRVKNFDYRVNLTMSYGWNKNVIKDYAENAKWVDVEQGKSLSYIKGYRFDRILRTQEELDNFNKEHPGYRIGGVTPELGMMVYKDFSGPDGKPDNVIDSWDKEVLYKNNDPIVYGLSLGGNWKNFSVDLLFNGLLNYEKLYKDLAGGTDFCRLWSDWHSDSWSEDNPNATLPKRRLSNMPRTYNEDSDYWYKDASFLRLKYLNVGYTIPQSVYKGAVDRIKLFVSGTNLFTWSHFKYYDPEASSGMAYPIMRSFSFGAEVTF